MNGAETPMVTVPRAVLAELRGEVAQLSERLDDITAELERRDVEQMELEGAVEFLLDNDRTFRHVIGGVIRRTIGDSDDRYGGASMMKQLYPSRHPAGFGQAGFVRWRRPSRRWAAFGPRCELIAKLQAAGVNFKPRDSREWMIRDAWSHRDDEGMPAPALPGGVGPFI